MLFEYLPQKPRHAFVVIENSTQSGILILRVFPEKKNMYMK